MCRAASVPSHPETAHGLSIVIIIIIIIIIIIAPLSIMSEDECLYKACQSAITDGGFAATLA